MVGEREGSQGRKGRIGRIEERRKWLPHIAMFGLFIASIAVTLSS